MISINASSAALGAPDDFKWELYHVAEDLSQSKNLAAEKPAKLKELQTLFDEPRNAISNPSQ